MKIYLNQMIDLKYPITINAISNHLQITYHQAVVSYYRNKNRLSLVLTDADINGQYKDLNASKMSIAHLLLIKKMVL